MEKSAALCFSQSPPQGPVGVKAQTPALCSSLGLGDENLSHAGEAAEPHNALYSTHFDGSVGKCFWQMVMSLFSPWELTKQGQFCNKTAAVKQT